MGSKKSPRIVAIVPMRHTSERVPGKNYRLFAGKPLFHRIIATLASSRLISEVVIDTDSSVIIQDSAKNFPEVTILNRPEHLRDGGIAMNDVLLNTVKQVEADFYIQTHSTNPLLRPETVTSAIERLLETQTHKDSLFSVTRLQVRLWSENCHAINHDPQVLLRTQDLPPIFAENSCIYIFSRRSLEENKNRIGKSPIMFEMDATEAWDIDNEADFEIAEFLFNRHKSGSDVKK